MTDTPAWLARYGVDLARDYEPNRWCSIDLAFFAEIDRLNDRIAVLESGQREMETRIPTEGGS